MANYVKNKDLREALVLSKQQDELTAEALDMIIIMANRFSQKFTYVYPDDRKDCIAVAIMDCYLYWRNYNPEKSQNAFAYITQIIKSGYAKAWRTLHGKLPVGSRVSISDGKIYNL